jgi:hypothetical protein
MCRLTEPRNSADVEALRGTESGASVFDLMSAIGAHDHGRALRILARNLENGEAPLRILGALVWQYRRLWKMKEQLKAGGREGEAARTLRMDPSRVRGFLAQFSDAQLTQTFRWFSGHRLEAQRREWKRPCSGDGRPLVPTLWPAVEISIIRSAGAAGTTGPAPVGFETGVECQNRYAEAVSAFTRTVSRETRREAVLGFKTPLVTALLKR